MKKIIGFVIVFLGVVSLNAQSLPKQFETIGDYSIKGEKQYYSSSNLYDYINGASDFYLGYGFKDLWVVDYQNNNGQFATLELYQHGSEDLAFGIYSEERPLEAELEDIGAEGFVEGGSVFFLAGTYYVKIYNGKPGMTENGLIKFAQQVSKQICTSCAMPQPLSLLPNKDKLPSSERYMAENFMGITGFNGAFTAKYDEREEDFRMFVYYADDERCQTILNAYFNRVDYKKRVKPKTYQFDDPYLGKVMMTYKEGCIAGLLDSSNPEEHIDLYQALLDGLK